MINRSEDLTEEIRTYLAIIHTNISICCLQLKQTQTAFQNVNKAIEYDVQYQKAYYRKVLILREMGQLRECFEIAKELWKRNPKDKTIDKLMVQHSPQF
jgi:tetratricopeptide (TPR) repeat protein